MRTVIHYVILLRSQNFRFLQASGKIMKCFAVRNVFEPSNDTIWLPVITFWLL